MRGRREREREQVPEPGEVRFERTQRELEIHRPGGVDDGFRAAREPRVGFGCETEDG